MWFRRDLRLSDNPALVAASANNSVTPVYIDDPIFDGSTGRRRSYLRSCLIELDVQMDDALVVRRGDPAIEVARVAAEIGAETVYISADFGAYGRQRDAAVRAQLDAQRCTLITVGSPYAVEPGTVRKPDGNPYAVFTPWSKRWRAIGWAPPVDVPDTTWTSAPCDGYPASGADVPDWCVTSHDAAIARWDAFRASGLDSYATRRDLPGQDATSRLSPALRMGLLHPRELLADLDPTNENHQVFATELGWREFYADVMFHRPQSIASNLNTTFDRIEVDTNSQARVRFERWCAGKTGFPIVDAGMRQLVATGWMHNRVRMIVASFLVKDLHLPWQWGERFFMTQLVDGDRASNAHGWQWAAGCGTDAAPYFRVFNPTTQQTKWDPHDTYVRRWVPEYGTDRYPSPMVDHSAERLEALARFNALRALR